MIRQSSLGAEAGMGLFTVVDIKRGELITYFDGRIIVRDEARALRAAGRASHIKTLRGAFDIDGSDIGPESLGFGAASFANDASRGVGHGHLGNVYAKNNSEDHFINLEHVHVHQKLKIPLFSKSWSAGVECCFLRAVCDIAAGEEIFASYGKGYWQLIDIRRSGPSSSLVQAPAAVVSQSHDQLQSTHVNISVHMWLMITETRYRYRYRSSPTAATGPGVWSRSASLFNSFIRQRLDLRVVGPHMHAYDQHQLNVGMLTECSGMSHCCFLRPIVVF